MNESLTAFEMNRGEVEIIELFSGEKVQFELLETAAAIIDTNLKELKVEQSGGHTDYRFSCHVKINGREYILEREVATAGSFYEPWEISGLRIWFDAVKDIFSFLAEAHGACRPYKDARFAVQDASKRICPELLHPWCPVPEDGLNIEDCYRGEDCWLGAYNGASAHGGLDINHPPGTPLWAPFDLDDNFYFNSLTMGHNNNRWRGIRRWPDGSEWVIQAHHMTELTVEEHKPVRRGQQFAWGAGVHSGVVDHSHFVFKIHDRGETIMLDPWILFWQIYQDKNALQSK